MVNAQEGQDPIDNEKFNIDGNYVPRVIFLDGSANILEDIVNQKGNPKYRYYHTNEDTVIHSMTKTIGMTSSKNNSTEAGSTEL